MALKYGPTVVSNGLILALDAKDKVSYPGSGTTWYNVASTPNATIDSPSMLVDGAMQHSYNQSYIGALSATGTHDNTMEVWFYVPSGGSYGGCCETIFGTYWFRTFLIGTALFTMIGFYTGSGYDYQHPAYTIAYNVWHHAVGMRRNGRYIIWLDGVEVYNTTYGDNLPLYDAVGDWRISNPAHSSVKVALARVYNRGLSDAELLQNFNANKTRFGL